MKAHYSLFMFEVLIFSIHARSVHAYNFPRSKQMEPGKGNKIHMWQHSWVGLDGDEGQQKGKKTIAHLHYLVFGTRKWEKRNT
jgi:hypothetical protein